METAYALWHRAMYVVGVFVTCNVGGAMLRLAAGRVSALLNRRKVSGKPKTPVTVGEVPLSQAIATVSGLFASGLTSVLLAESDEQERSGSKERFEDIQRQIRTDTRKDATASEDDSDALETPEREDVSEAAGDTPNADE